MFQHYTATRLSIAYYNKIVEILETAPELQRTASGVCKQTCLAAAGTAIGGLMGGPVGAVVGGSVGLYIGYRTVHDYRSLVDVLRTLDDEQKARLVRGVQELIGTATIEDLVQFATTEAGRIALFDMIRTITGGNTKTPSTCEGSPEAKYPKFD